MKLIEIKIQVVLLQKRKQSKRLGICPNIHHFRDEALNSDNPPTEHVVIFDESQRAWNKDQTARFMKEEVLLILICQNLSF